MDEWGNMKEYLVDIIVPMFNQEQCIEKCIESILKQTYKMIHLILVDDGSTDNTLKICRKYKEISYITIVTQKNQGVAAARNKGLSYTEGDCIVFIDADDYVANNYIETLVNSIENFDLIVTGNTWIDIKGKIIQKNVPPMITVENIYEIGKFIFQKDYFKYFTSPWGKLFKRNIILENNIKFRDLSYGEDTCFVFDYISCIHNIKMIDSTGYNYITTINSLSRKYIKRIWPLLKDINEYCRKDFYELYGSEWNYMYLRIIKVALGNSTQRYKFFSRQFTEIRSDEDYKYLKTTLQKDVSDKLMCFLVKNNLKLACFFAYKMRR